MRRALAAGCLLLALAGCTTKAKAASGPSAVASSALTSTAKKVAADGPFPDVAGGFGDKPQLSYPTSAGPAKLLQRKILHSGTGAGLVEGDLVAVDYLGQLWHGKTFDNSYDRKVATAVQIGIGKVIKGWDTALVGLRVGSRVELSIPPGDGYGTKGDSAAGIKGTDTLVFVVDIGAKYDAHSVADPAAVAVPLPSGTPKVTGAPPKAPEISIPKGLALPKKVATYVIDRATGTPLADGTAVIQYSAVNWLGSIVGSTWQNGTATSVPVGGASSGAGGLFDGLRGIPIGSRVLIVAPAPAGQDAQQNSVAAVVDIVGQVKTAKQMAA